MSNRTKPNQRTDWVLVESEFVFGPGASYGQIAKKFKVSRAACEWHGSPKRGNWQEKRKRYLREVEEVARKRLAGEAGEDTADRLRPFKERYVETTAGMQELVDILIRRFVPGENATELERREAMDRIAALTPNQMAQIIISGTDRVGGAAKIMQLLGGEATERIEVVPVGDDVSAITEQEIERALRTARGG